MNPKDLITPRIVDFCRDLPLIFVVGVTKSGKITIAKELSKQLDNRILLISDEYVEKYDHNDALNMLERDMNENYYSTFPIIVEGILGFRLLRRMSQNGYHLPNIVIKTECNENTIRHFYQLEEQNKNLNSVFGFNKGLNSIWLETLEIVHSQGRQLKVLTLNTSIF